MEKRKGTLSFVTLRGLSYDLEKVFAVCFTDQWLVRLKQRVFLFPPRRLQIWAVNSSIAQSHYCISNDETNFPESSMERWCCLHPRSQSQWKFTLVCFCSISQLNVLHFCLRSVFTFSFQGHMKVALSQSALYLIINTCFSGALIQVKWGVWYSGEITRLPSMWRGFDSQAWPNADWVCWFSTLLRVLRLFWVAFMVRHYSRSKLADWTSEGWI